LVVSIPVRNYFSIVALIITSVFACMANESILLCD
jgi:hypothetical protein